MRALTDLPVSSSDSGALLHVWVVPGAARTEISGLHGDKLKLRVSAPPEGGKANRETRRFLEKRLEAKVHLVRGITGRHKVFEVAGVDAETVCGKLGL